MGHKKQKKIARQVVEKKPKTQPIGGAKNGGQRTIITKENRLYPTEKNSCSFSKKKCC